MFPCVATGPMPSDRNVITIPSINFAHQGLFMHKSIESIIHYHHEHSQPQIRANTKCVDCDDN